MQLELNCAIAQRRRSHRCSQPAPIIYWTDATLLSMYLIRPY
ncbi:hypothetical protein [Nostoc sp.]